jgi:hypothetical protein
LPIDIEEFSFYNNLKRKGRTGGQMEGAMRFEGLLAGLATFAMIGFFHPLVVKCEYYFSERIWPFFALAGFAGIFASVFTDGLLSILLAIFGCTAIWSVRELKEQTRRVQKGWFPANPMREAKSRLALGKERLAVEKLAGEKRAVAGGE